MILNVVSICCYAFQGRKARAHHRPQAYEAAFDWKPTTNQ